MLVSAGIVKGDIRTVSPGGTVFIGEEQIDISAGGIGPGSQIAWWAPGTSLVETPADVITVSDPTRFSAMSSSFSGKEGVWYSVGDKSPVITIKEPRLRLRISDTTSDFDATGKWFPRGHVASFQIETNLYELRSREGVQGAPIDIRINSPQGGEYSAVSGPQGSYSLSAIPVTSSQYDTGGIWNTQGSDSGTYTITAECTANRLNDNNPGPGAGVSEPIDILLQDVNPLITEKNQKEENITAKQKSTEQEVPRPTLTKVIPLPTITANASPQQIQTPLANNTPAPIQTVASIQTERPTSTSMSVPTEPSPSSTQATPLPAILAVIAILYTTIRQ